MQQPFRISRLTRVVYGLALGGTLVVGVINFVRALSRAGDRPDIFDFHIFHLVGGLVWSGRLPDAYRLATLQPLETALSGHDSFMPWSYPPLFALALAPFAALPGPVAFALFVTATLAFYLLAMRRLGGVYSWPVLLAATPSVAINVGSGQNGLLTGGLVASAALSLLARKPIKTGLALAALAIKPHLAMLLPFTLALERRWLALAVGAAGAVVLTGLSIAILGTDAFSAFLTSFSEVRRFMAFGAYPLHRMTTVYSFVLSLGASGSAAILAHVAVALAVLGWSANVAVRSDDLRVRTGLSVMATVFVSPYFYDYDQTVFAVGLLLVAPALVAAMPPRRYGLLLATIAISQAVGIISNSLYDLSTASHLSLTAPMLLACYALILRTLAPKGVAAGVDAGVDRRLA